LDSGEKAVAIAVWLDNPNLSDEEREFWRDAAKYWREQARVEFKKT